MLFTFEECLIKLFSNPKNSIQSLNFMFSFGGFAIVIGCEPNNDGFCSFVLLV